MTSKLETIPQTSDEFAREIGLNPLQKQQQREEYAQAKARSVASLSLSPLHQARQAKNPKYFDNLKPGMGWPEVD